MLNCVYFVYEFKEINISIYPINIIEEDKKNGIITLDLKDTHIVNDIIQYDNSLLYPGENKLKYMPDKISDYKVLNPKKPRYCKDNVFKDEIHVFNTLKSAILFRNELIDNKIDIKLKEIQSLQQYKYNY